MSQRSVKLQHLKLQNIIFFKFAPTLSLNFFWCAMDRGLIVGVHLSRALADLEAYKCIQNGDLCSNWLLFGLIFCNSKCFCQ